MTIMYCHPFFAAQSDVPLDIQEVDKSVAVVSYTPPDEEVSQLSVWPRCTNTLYVYMCVCMLRMYTGSVAVHAPDTHVAAQGGYHLLCSLTCSRCSKL